MLHSTFPCFLWIREDRCAVDTPCHFWDPKNEVLREIFADFIAPQFHHHAKAMGA